MSEQIDPAIPADLAWRDGEMIIIRARPGTYLEGELHQIGAQHCGEDLLAIDAGQSADVIRIVNAEEMSQRIHPGIPTSQAWKDGRRIYVRSAKGSRLSEGLWRIGAHWDRDEYCLWVGSGKLAQAVALVLEDQQRKARAEEIRALGLLVKIPFEAAAVRAEAKKLGAVWVNDAKAWAMPDADSFGKVQAMAGEWREAEKARKDKEKAASAARRAARKQTPEEVIARSGRTVTAGAVPVHFERELHGYMRRAEAEGYAAEPGGIRLVRGIRYLVLKGSVGFWNEDMCADLNPHWEPGWKESWTGIAVESTEEERAADEEQAARDKARQEQEAAAKADAGALAALVARAKDGMTWLAEGDRYPDGPAAGRIAVREGTAPGRTYAYLTLTGDGRIWWDHPGYYDDYRRSTGWKADPGLAAEFREVLAAGPRERTVTDRGYARTYIVQPGGRQ